MMEMRAYIDGIVRKWWLLGLVIVLSWLIGGFIGNNLTSEYTATASVLINDKILTDTAFPSNTVQLTLPTSYNGLLTAPALLNRISKTYPRLSLTQLQGSISVTTDPTNQIMLIQVNDISAFATADIANFLAQTFIKEQSAELEKQLTFYQQWLQPNVARLSDQINALNKQIDTLTPQQQLHEPIPTLTPAQSKQLSEQVSQRDQDTRTLYAYQEALTEVLQVLPFVPGIYTILKPAAVPDTPTTSPPSVTTVRLISLAVGLLTALCLLVTIEFFTPIVRHKDELPRVIGVSVLAEVPQLSRFEQQRLLESRPLPFTDRVKPLRLLCASISTIVVKKSKGQTVLLTTPRKKRPFAALLAIFLAKKGHKTLLIDADFKNPSLHEQIQVAGSCNITTSSGRLLSFVYETNQPGLFLLPAAAAPAQEQGFTEAALLELLPELQSAFDLVILDAPPLDSLATHVFATKVSQVLMVVKKRRDSLKEMKEARAICELLKLSPHYIFLS